MFYAMKAFFENYHIFVFFLFQTNKIPKKKFTHTYFHEIDFCGASRQVALQLQLTLCFCDRLRQPCNILEIFFTVVFTLEMALKIVGNGLAKYLKNGWCLLDFLIVVTSWAALAILWSATEDVAVLGALKALRALRAFRPLRTVGRLGGMKVVMDSLIESIPSIANVFLVFCFFWIVFAIVGVNLFGGKFGYCTNFDGVRVETTEIWDRAECRRRNSSGYTWQVQSVKISQNQFLDFSFVRKFLKRPESHENCDNVIFSLIALFQIATFEGWMEVIAYAQDSNSTAKYQQPSFGANSVAAYVFSYLFIIIGSFFFLNLIVGVIIESFQAQSKEAKMSKLEVIMTDDQRKFVKAIKALFTAKPKKICPRPNPNLGAPFKLRAYAWDVVMNSTFEMIVFITIIMNMFLLAAESYGLDDNMKDILFKLDIVFTTMFCIEACLKIFALRIHYFMDTFNNFDFIICVASVIGLVIEVAAAAAFSPSLIRIVRIFRVFRILRAVRAARGIRRLMITLVVSLPALTNIMILIVVFLIIFSVLGMTAFMDRPLAGALNDVVNFKTFPTSFVLLLRLMTAAGWNDVFDGLLENNMCTTTFSDPDLTTEGCMDYFITRGSISAEIAEIESLQSQQGNLCNLRKNLSNLCKISAES